MDECVLCCREIRIYATGACDHPVCYECSTRMRVLCETNECPICRSNMPVVIFTHQQHSFSDIAEQFFLHDKRYQIIFEDNDIQKSFESLLENKCKLCNEVCCSFDKLKEHVRRKHELHYCDLCADNLKIFTFERKCYSRRDLARHRRYGDPDETSHRGHPLCEFCDQRYIDMDDLYRHLRREHFFCHFCDLDGRHQYYKDYDYLRVHFRKEHFLCEEGECVHEKFTGAFRSKIDLQAHIAVYHTRNKSKAEAKQARMLDLEFTISHHRPTGNSSPRGGRFTQHRKRNIDDPNLRDNSVTHQTDVEKFDTQSTQEFPYLSEDVSNSTNHFPKPVLNSNLNSVTVQSYGRNSASQNRKITMSDEDFPTLSSTTVAITSEVADNQSGKVSLNTNRQDTFPVRASNVSIQLSQKNIVARNLNLFQDHKSHVSKISSDTANNKNLSQTPKWVAKKESLNFENEFPKLEGKRTPLDSSLSTNFVANTVQDNTSMISMVTNSGNQTVNGQFVIIKSKSKKKKQNKSFMDSKSNSDKDDTDLSELCSKPNENKSTSILNDQENKDPFKKSIVRPVSVHKNSYMEENSWEQKASFDQSDFPPLAPSEPIKRPPGFNVPKKRTPPPGFSTNSSSNTNSAPLNISLSSIARQIVVPNQNKVNRDVEINTNYDSLQKICSTGDIYKKPPDFEKRNEKLIKRIHELSNAQQLLFNDFKTLSGNFRQSKMSAAEYHTKCLEILDEKGFLEIFPELISLLPDINKQQELLAVHNRFLKSQKNSGAVPKQRMLTSSQVLACDLCQQVLMKNDYKHHKLSHGEQSE